MTEYDGKGMTILVNLIPGLERDINRGAVVVELAEQKLITLSEIERIQHNLGCVAQSLRQLQKAELS